MIKTSKEIRIFFEITKCHIDLPFSTTFPRNCCEASSLFLGNYLKEKFPDVKVDYVKGTDSNSSIHFWLEVEGKVYDITADQFDEFDAPLWNADRHPLEAIYSDLERKDIVTAFVTSDVTTETYKHSLMIEIENYLESKR